MKGDKKYTATIGGKTRSFGAKGFSISPGTPKGDNYCARSSGIKKCANPPVRMPFPEGLGAVWERNLLPQGLLSFSGNNIFAAKFI